MTIRQHTFTKPWRLVAALAISALTAACSHAPPVARAGVHAKGEVDDRDEAFELLSTPNGELYFSNAEIDQVVSALRLVRAKYPDIRDLEEYSSGSSTEIQLTDTAIFEFQKRMPRGWQGDSTIQRIGIPSIDSISDRLRVNDYSVHGRDFFGRQMYFFSPGFARQTNVAAAERIFNATSGIRSAARLSMGSGGGISLTRAGTLFTFNFQRAWGDCPSGCINRHIWIIQVDTKTKQITKLRDYGSPWPPVDH